jgi:hypothetical protein
MLTSVYSLAHALGRKSMWHVGRTIYTARVTAHYLTTTANPTATESG